MKLFIVESPKKIKTICSILGKSYSGASTYGHIMDLASDNMSIDFENNFEPTYVVIKSDNPRTDKRKVVKDIINIAKDAKEILLATDKDREGEMISWNLAHILKLKNPKRIVFTSITKKSLNDAIANVDTINYNMVYSQQCRRVLDRIVGYKLSPLIDSFMNSHGLSAGRVQSVVTRLIVDRENEIDKFFSNKNINSHFNFDGVFNIPDKKNQQFKAQMFTKKVPLTSNPFKGELSKISSKEESEQLLTTMIDSIFKIKNIFTKKRTQSSPNPYTTSTLQQDASHKLSFNGKRTMLAAQHLYEAGYITYMRTDSITLSDEALNDIQKYILETYDKKYYKRTIYKMSDEAQGAHECIRPTEIYTTELEENDKIQQDEIKLYKLIWKRTVACQMANAEFNDLNIQIEINNLKEYYFSTCVASLVFDGFLILYKNNKKNDDDDDENDENINNDKLDFVEGTELKVVNVKATQKYETPPARYNEASILNKLDINNLNIGRPATLVNIVQKIIDKKYAMVSDTDGKNFQSFVLTLSSKTNKIIEESKTVTLSKEKKKFVPTKLGIVITNYLTLHFSKIMDYQFTANMEQKLDDIANGKLVWHEVVREFYEDFNPLVMARVSVNNITKGKNQKLLGNYNNADIFVTTTTYGPCIKYMSGINAKFLNIVEPLTIETITLEQAIKIIDENSGFPKLLGLYERKKVILKKNGDSYYFSHNKKNFPSHSPNLTLDEAIKIIKSNGKIPLKQITAGNKICSVYQGKDNKYINILTTKNKKSFNVPLPDGENIENLTIERINIIINKAYTKK
jgi:DNA topoisomerase-1